MPYFIKFFLKVNVFANSYKISCILASTILLYLQRLTPNRENKERVLFMHFILLAVVVVLAVVIYKLKSDKDNHM